RWSPRREDVTRTRTAEARRLSIRVRSGADAGDQGSESGSPAHPREFSHSIYRFGNAGRIHIESFRNQPLYLKKWFSSNKTSAPNRLRLQSHGRARARHPRSGRIMTGFLRARFEKSLSPLYFSYYSWASSRAGNSLVSGKLYRPA